MDLDLARRAVASPRWRWAAGLPLAGDEGYSVDQVREDGGVGVVDEYGYWGGEYIADPLPDMGSPLVLGWLLHLVRERFPLFTVTPGDPSARDPSEREWFADWGAGSSFSVSAETETGLLVAALELP